MQKFRIKRTANTIGHLQNIPREKRGFSWIESAPGVPATFASRESAQARINQIFRTWQANGYHCAHNEIGVPELEIIAF